MAGYPSAEAQAQPSTVFTDAFSEDSSGWILAEADEPVSAEAEEELLSGQVSDETLKIDMALAFPSLARCSGAKLDMVLSVLSPPAQKTDRAPLRLVAVLDRSGSMRGENLKLVIETMKFMLQHLTEKDALGVVVFDTTVKVLAPLTRCSSEGRAHLESVIARVKAGSQTNLSGGLLRGLELHGEALRESVDSPLAAQRISFGNMYRRLPEEIEREGLKPAPAGCARVHEWSMELRSESDTDAALIQKVVYELHDTCADKFVEATEAPFRMTSVGWGVFKVKAKVYLHDGRTLELDHELCFDQPESFRTMFVSLESPPEQISPAGSNLPSPPVQVAAADEQAVVRSTFIFTDGAANVGIQQPDELCVAVSAALGELENIPSTISTFGFGKDHSADLLRNIAHTGKGVYCFIEDTDSIGEAFGEALGGLLSMSHQNVRLILELAPGVTFEKARTSYQVDGPAAIEKGWHSVAIELGDLYAEERRDILVELALPEAAEDGPHNFGRFNVRGFSVLRSCTDRACSELVIERQLTDDAVQGPMHPQVERHRNRYIASEALDAARAAGRHGDLAKARQTLDKAASALAASPLAFGGCAMTGALMADVQECRQDLRDEATYTGTGSKKMAYMQMAHERQRTCGGTSTAMYCNSVSLKMKSDGGNFTA